MLQLAPAIEAVDDEEDDRAGVISIISEPEPTWSGNGIMPVSMISGDDIPSLYHNPFAGHSESSFTTAISPKRSRAEARPVHRRRGSEGSPKRTRNDHDPWAQDDEVSGNFHSRSRTVDGGLPASTPTSLHPLAFGHYTSRSTMNLPSPSDSRPYLKRALSEMDTSQGSADDEQEEATPVANYPEREMMVIVHKVRSRSLFELPALTSLYVQVSPQDSVAGVALKYGISLADLRRTNQLWATDSIHLRQVLYIPLEFVQNSKQLKLSLAELDVSGVSSKEGLPESQSAHQTRSEMDAGVGVGGNLTLRRVPASQLSFFPRPTTNASSASTHSLSSTSRTLPRSFQTTFRHPDLPAEFSPLHSSSSTPPSSLLPSIPLPSGSSTSLLPTRSQISSLFNALPLAPSTRDTIIARLSLDSGASTPTQSSDDQDLELEDVGVASRRRVRTHETSHAVEIDGSPTSDLANFLSIRGNSKGLDAPLELRSFMPSISAPSRSPARTRPRIQIYHRSRPSNTTTSRL